MIESKHLAALVAGAALATAVGTASATTSAYNNCGTVSAGGRSWALASTGIGCPVAIGILKKLAPKAPASGFYHFTGTYSRMKCSSSVGTAKRAVLCLSFDGRTTLTALSH